MEKLAVSLSSTSAELLSEGSAQPEDQTVAVAAVLKQLSEKARVFVFETVKSLCKHLS